MKRTNWITTLCGFLAATLPVIGHQLGAPYKAIADWLAQGALLCLGLFAADARNVPPA